MGENKFNYVVGIALVVLLVLVVYLGGRVKTIEADVNDLYGRVLDVETFLDLTTIPADEGLLDEESLLVPEEEFVLAEDLEAYGLGAFDDYYYDDGGYYNASNYYDDVGDYYDYSY